MFQNDIAVDIMLGLYLDPVANQSSDCFGDGKSTSYTSKRCNNITTSQSLTSKRYDSIYYFLNNYFIRTGYKKSFDMNMNPQGDPIFYDNAYDLYHNYSRLTRPRNLRDKDGVKKEGYIDLLDLPLSMSV